VAKILIVDDDAALRISFAKILQGEGHNVQSAASGEAGIEIYTSFNPDLVIQDVRLPGMVGLETFSRMKELDPSVQSIIMTAYGTTETAITATSMGAFDYLLKPFEIPEMLELIGKALEASRFSRKKVRLDADSEDLDVDAIIGGSRAMQNLYKSIGRVAPTDALVLVRGESGTGKELVARAVFQHSMRSDKPFVVINCVAIPETLLESELFGYERGAFTGANTRKIGRIEQADGGTVFLDEIGDMPLSIQAKILRLLQEKSIERIGGRETIPIDVRIIAATNRNLEQAINDGLFREDLYYRLKVVTLPLPPLRERLTDLPQLTEYFLRRLSTVPGMSNPGISRSGLLALQEHSWPGNVRELANCIQKALIFNRGAPISAEDIQSAIKGDRSCSAEAADTNENHGVEIIRRTLSSGDENAYANLMDRFSSMVITEALSMCDGNRSKASRLLGMSRPTLLSRMERLGLRVSAKVSSDNSSEKN
jgi:DNA-binding NtrC family response regulator